MFTRLAFALLFAQLACSAATYSYDNAGRLIKIDYGASGAVTYAYDNAGNLISRAVQPGSVSGPVITSVVNAESGSSTIAPNTWVEIDGSNLAPTGSQRTWGDADFANNLLPVQLDGVGVKVNGKNAFVYFISSKQVNILTPPDALQGAVQVQLTTGNATSPAFTAQAQALSPSFFVYGGTPYVAARHADGNLIGPSNLYAGASTPVKPNETVQLYANGFGPTSATVVSGSLSQSGTLSPLPIIKIGGITAQVTFAGLVFPGEFQFNVVIPASARDGDNSLIAAYGNGSSQSGVLITVQH